MQQVHCPHCQYPLFDNGLLAGQLVACPQCGGQFQMPGQVPMSVMYTTEPSPSIALFSSDRTAGRRHTPRNGSHFLIVLGLLGLVVLMGGGIAAVLSQRQHTNQSVVTPTRASQAAAAHSASAKIGQRRQKEAADLKLDELERRQREDERLRQGRQVSTENTKQQIDIEVQRQINAKRDDRETRLKAIAERERREIPPLEADIEAIEADIEAREAVRSEIANNQRSMPRSQAAMPAMPQSFGVPGGTRFQPTIPRAVPNVRDTGGPLRGPGRAIRLPDADSDLGQLNKRLRAAEGRLLQKKYELERERQKLDL